MKLLLTLLFIAASSFALCQVDSIGSGRCIRLDGVSSYVDLGNIYDNVHFPVSISVWLWIDPTSVGGMPVFDSQSNLQVYSGFYLSVSQTTIGIGYGDGTGEYDPVYRRGKQATVPNMAGRWVNVTTIIRGQVDMDIYLNGINVGGDYVGYSNLPMGFSPLEVAKIGFRDTNNLPVHFSGLIDELRIFSISLTQDQVQQMMCRKLKGNETGLIGYWTFDETTGNVIYDKSINGFSGQFVNGPTRQFSGAPIGNTSAYLYPAGWSGTTFSLTDGPRQIKVSNIQGNPGGIQLYEVTTAPSQQGGLDVTKIGSSYFGVYLASLTTAWFDATATNGGVPFCQTYLRPDNSVATWASNWLPQKSVVQSQEFIPFAGTKKTGRDTLICKGPGLLKAPFDATIFPIVWSTGDSSQSISVTQPGTYSVHIKGCPQVTDSVVTTFGVAPQLGRDTILCNASRFTINNTSPGSIHWSTGDTTRSLTVNKSGMYWAQSKTCSQLKDTIAIFFVASPSAFSLGADQKVCQLQPIKLNPFADTTGLTFAWQDGSKKSTFTVTTVGTYWLTVKNFCGQSSDTLHIVMNALDEKLIPNVITPNGDGKNDFYKLPDDFVGQVSLEIFNRWGKKVFHATGYRNDWNGGDLDAGTYFMLLSGGCIEKYKGPLTILR